MELKSRPETFVDGIIIHSLISLNKRRNCYQNIVLKNTDYRLGYQVLPHLDSKYNGSLIQLDLSQELPKET